MSNSPAFDPETEAFLASLKAAAENAPVTPPPPFKLRTPVARVVEVKAQPKGELHAEEAIKASEASSGEARGQESEAPGAEAGERKEPGQGAPPPELTRSSKKKARHAPTKEVGVGLMPHRMAAKDSSIARHASPKAEAGAEIMTLAEDHPAIVEGRTLFPESVKNTWESPRFLVSGKNNPKLGAEFRKGPWTGFPLYHLSLEERATCPRSCLQFRTCYGAGMPFARRNDHRDPDFIYALKAEVVTMARAHPAGFVVRLHTLGDFYSVEYVQMWADLLDTLPNLRIFGYSARREDADDEESRRIAKAIRWLTEQAWDLFAIRFSGFDGPQGSIVVSEPDTRDHVVMCPAQTYATAACVTCGLCSSPETKDKAIGFLLHGRKVKSQKASRPPSTFPAEGEADDAREDGGARVFSPDMRAAELGESDRKEMLRQRRIERAERIAASRLEDKPASDVIAEARAKISLAGRGQ